MRRLLQRLFQYLFPDSARTYPEIEPINQRRRELAGVSDEELKAAGRRATSLVEVVAVDGRGGGARAGPGNVRRAIAGCARDG